MLNWTDADINLGTVAESALDADLAGLAFSANATTVVGPVQTAFGYHILLVDEIIAGGTTELDDVQAQIIDTLRAEKAINLLYDKVNLLEDALGSGATLEEAITKAGGQLDLATDIDRMGQTIDGERPSGAVGELLQDGAILDLIWDSELNEVSVIQEGSDDMFFVVNVTAETAQRARTIAEVKSRVIADYKLVEAIKQARAKADVVASDQAADKDTPASTAFRRNGTGLDHEAAGLIAKAAFAQNAGDITVIETGREAIAVRTVDIIPASADDLTETTKLVMTVMNNGLGEDMTNLLLLSLSQKHDLQLNPAAVQQILLGTQQ